MDGEALQIPPSAEVNATIRPESRYISSEIILDGAAIEIFKEIEQCRGEDRR